MVVALQSSIQAVTVYSRGAKVTRMAVLGPWEGERPTRIRISGLPLAADDRSLHVRVEASNPNRPCPTAVDVRMTLDVPDHVDALTPAEDDELKQARREESRVHDRLSQVQRELSRLERLALVQRPKPLDGSAPPESPFAGRQALIAVRSARYEEQMAELRALKAELRECQRRRAELEDREARRSSARTVREHELRKTAVITLDTTSGDGEGHIFLDYLVPGARWAPSYSVVVDPGNASAEIAMRAVVAQQSGEDWDGVALTLSTADALGFSTLPELASIRIGPQKAPAAHVGWRPPPVGTRELYEDFDRAFGARLARSALAGSSGAEPLEEDEDDFVEEHLETTPYMEAVTKEHDVREYEEMLREDDDVTMNASTALLAHRKAKKARGKVREERASRRTMPMFEEEAAAFVAQSAPPPAPAAALPVSVIAPPAPVLGAAKAAPTEAFGTIGGSVEDERNVTASPDLLDYGSLYMPGPSDPDRGRLRKVLTADRYLELLRDRDVEVPFDVVRRVSEATYEAREVEYLDPPAGCTFAWSDRFDYAYGATSAATIASDGRFHSVPIVKASGKARLGHVCVPRASTDVYRLATVENPFEAPLMTGPADVYLGAEFIVTSELSVTPRGAEIELGLGVEQSIKVARNTRYGEDSAGLLGGSRSLRHEILIEVANLLERAADIEIRERIPVVAEDEEHIKVEIGKVTPPWTEYQPFPDEASAPALRGGHRWILRLDGGDKRDLRVHYEVKISSKNELVGGNRRE